MAAHNAEIDMVRQDDTRVVWTQDTVKRLGRNCDEVLGTDNNADPGTESYSYPDHETYCYKRSMIDPNKFAKPQSTEVRPITGLGGGLASLHEAIALSCVALAGEIEGTGSLRKHKECFVLECISA